MDKSLWPLHPGLSLTFIFNTGKIMGHDDKDGQIECDWDSNVKHVTQKVSILFSTTGLHINKIRIIHQTFIKFYTLTFVLIVNFKQIFS
jgi:hypothetical protein